MWKSASAVGHLLAGAGAGVALAGGGAGGCLYGGCGGLRGEQKERCDHPPLLLPVGPPAKPPAIQLSCL